MSEAQSISEETNATGEGPAGRGREVLLCTVLALAALLPGCSSAPEAPNQPPTADFIYTPVAPVNAGQTQVTFNASGSEDPDGTIESYVWDFGDGTPPQTTQAAVTTHVFPDTTARCVDITYTVLLLVTDNKGGRGSANDTVTVTELPVPGSTQCPG